MSPWALRSAQHKSLRSFLAFVLSGLIWVCFLIPHFPICFEMSKFPGSHFSYFLDILVYVFLTLDSGPWLCSAPAVFMYCSSCYWLLWLPVWDPNYAAVSCLISKSSKNKSNPWDSQQIHQNVANKFHLLQSQGRE